MQLKPQRRLQLGLTLIELMISIVLSLFVLGGVLYITSSTMQSNTQNLRSTHLNQELRAAMQMITRDIRRAGYRYGVETAGAYTANNSVTIAPLTGSSIVVTAPASAPFGKWIIGSRIRHVSASTGLSYCIDISSPTTGTSFTSATGAFVDCEDSSDPTAFPSASIGAGSWTIEDPNGGIQFTANCVSFGYDVDNDVGDGDIAASEVIGYRLNGSAIERGSSADCSTNTFASTEAVISSAVSGVTITNFSVTNLGPAAAIPAGNVDIQLLELQLTLSGQLSSDSSVTRSITEVVKVRNDQLI